MSTRDMDLLIREELQGERPIQDGYAAFCASLDKALRITADEMAARGGETSLADDAIHFALLSYAAGVASSRYVALLRQQKDAEAKKTTITIWTAGKSVFPISTAASAPARPLPPLPSAWVRLKRPCARCWRAGGIFCA